MDQVEYAIIVAGGKGTRMQSSTPKQFLEIGGVPIILRSLKAFYSYSKSVRLIVVLPKPEIGRWNDLCRENDFDLKITVVEGGETRFDSVKNGLAKVEKPGLVAVHDAVRPFVTKEIISQCYRSAAQHGSGVAAVGLKDSIRELIDESKSQSVDRDHYRLVQTPQTFRSELIIEAYNKAQHRSFTDDAGVYENNGNSVRLVEGGYENFKITDKLDLLRAESYVKHLPD